MTCLHMRETTAKYVLYDIYDTSYLVNIRGQCWVQFSLRPAGVAVYLRINAELAQTNQCWSLSIKVHLFENRIF